MNNYIKLTIFLTFFVFFCALEGLSQVAPWAKLSKNAPDNLSARQYPVPTKEEVGIPIYPGAVLTSVSAPREDTLKYAKEVLPFINLVTSAVPSKVISFYKGKLSSGSGWTYNAEYNTFVKGSTLSALTGFVPAVGIREETGDNFDLVYVDERFKSKLRTRIQIFYNPVK